MINPVTRYLGIGAMVVILALSAWGWRVDGLRADYRQKLDDVVTVATKEGGYKTTRDAVDKAFALAVQDRNTARTGLLAAQGLIDVQNNSIVHLQKESEQAAEQADAARKLVASTIKERNAWIDRAKLAETRTSRLTAEQEVAECEQVLDSLYSAGF